MLAILTSLIVCGCSAFSAEQNLDQSEAAYERCEVTSATGSGGCESQKQDVDANKQIYDQTSGQPPVWIGGRKFQPLTRLPNQNTEPDSTEGN